MQERANPLNEQYKGTDPEEGGADTCACVIGGYETEDKTGAYLACAAVGVASRWEFMG